MPVIVSLLGGVNIGGHHKIKMDALRGLCESLGLRHPRTYLQSGNIVFSTSRRDLAKLASQIEGAIEKEFGFHAGTILRTVPELRDVVARNPFGAPERIISSFAARNASADPFPLFMNA